ncbi:hypothetical protein D3C87_1642220 [compost metagenome]
MLRWPSQPLGFGVPGGELRGTLTEHLIDQRAFDGLRGIQRCLIHPGVRGPVVAVHHARRRADGHKLRAVPPGAGRRELLDHQALGLGRQGVRAPRVLHAAMLSDDGVADVHAYLLKAYPISETGVS